MPDLFDDQLLEQAAVVLRRAEDLGLRVATAETVTGGLVSATLTSVSGASNVFERGFVFYHRTAKGVGLGIDESISQRHGVVSAAVTDALAAKLLENSTADAGVALTGYAGPTGGNEQDPVGTVYTSAVRSGYPTLTERHVFDGDRAQVKLQGVEVALRLLGDQLAS